MIKGIMGNVAKLHYDADAGSVTGIFRKLTKISMSSEGVSKFETSVEEKKEEKVESQPKVRMLRFHDETIAKKPSSSPFASWVNGEDPPPKKKSQIDASKSDFPIMYQL